MNDYEVGLINALDLIDQGHSAQPNSQGIQTFSCNNLIVSPDVSPLIRPIANPLINRSYPLNEQSANHVVSITTERNQVQSISNSPTSSGTKVNKRRLDLENNQENLDVTLPKKKRGRKLGSKNKKTMEKERLEKEKRILS
ncbi:unnamed protein product [Brachionus calyciflorus]|uniref:Uncharacterized protein n=1 Tax=Brachionus calyciflorus TaxID=104777 RepID=A0A813X6C0_9BILA|nr:unnamed protein product [Brachionus calyciflorus]